MVFCPSVTQILTPFDKNRPFAIQAKKKSAAVWLAIERNVIVRNTSQSLLTGVALIFWRCTCRSEHVVNFEEHNLSCLYNCTFFIFFIVCRRPRQPSALNWKQSPTNNPGVFICQSVWWWSYFPGQSTELALAVHSWRDDTPKWHTIEIRLPKEVAWTIFIRRNHHEKGNGQRDRCRLEFVSAFLNSPTTAKYAGKLKFGHN